MNTKKKMKSMDGNTAAAHVAYAFSDGPVPPCPNEADLNGDGAINIQDITEAVNVLFLGGTLPVECP